LQQYVLTQLHANFRRVAIFAYLDDITLYGKPAKVAEVFIWLELLGLAINQDKCQLFYDAIKTPVLPDAFAGIKPSMTFIKILGSDGEIIEVTALTTNIDNYVKILPLILQLPASIAYVFKSFIHIHTGYYLNTAQFPENNLRMQDSDNIVTFRMQEIRIEQKPATPRTEG
jgi:hypothetical protein